MSTARRAALLLVIALTLSVPPRPLAAQEEPIVIYLVRHAERADDEGPVDPALASDPPLSEAGARRAEELAEVLGPVRPTHVHSTDYVRTRQTAAPLAEATDLGVELYEPADLAGFARRLRSTPGIHVVVGHSNTTPDLVEELGGSPGDPIDELEYDRIYVVYVLPGGATGSAVFRYGVPYGGSP